MSLVSFPPVRAQDKVVGATGFAPPILSPTSIQIFCPSDPTDENQYLALLSPKIPIVEGFFFAPADDETFRIENQADNAADGYDSLPDNSFHSIHSDN